MINSYKDDPRYKELLSVVAGGGSTEGLEEYLQAQGVTNNPYKYNTPPEGIMDYKNEEYNPYTNGMHFNIPNEYAQDYTKEYERLSQPENYDPLLMYILQKNAESGFANGPINTDLYYESYDPKNHPELEGDFTDFLDTYYPDFQERLKQARDADPNGETFKRLNDIDNMRYYNKHEFDYDDLYGNEDYGYPENLDQLYNEYYELNEPSVINRAKSDPELQQRINKLNKFFEDNQLL